MADGSEETSNRGDSWANDRATQIIHWAVAMGLVDYYVDDAGEFIFYPVGEEPV